MLLREMSKKRQRFAPYFESLPRLHEQLCAESIPPGLLPLLQDDALVSCGFGPILSVNIEENISKRSLTPKRMPPTCKTNHNQYRLITQICNCICLSSAFSMPLACVVSGQDPAAS